MGCRRPARLCDGFHVPGVVHDQAWRWYYVSDGGRGGRWVACRLPDLRVIIRPEHGVSLPRGYDVSASPVPRQAGQAIAQVINLGVVGPPVVFKLRCWA
jgi:hypothetical protein